MSKEKGSSSLNKDLAIISSKVLAAITALAFAVEIGIFSIEPISRYLAVTLLQQISEEDQIPNDQYLSISNKISLAIEAAEEKGVHVYNDSDPISYTNAEVLNTAYLIGRHEVGDILRNHTINPDYFKHMAISVGRDYLPKELSYLLITYSANFQAYSNLTSIPPSGFARRQSPKQDILQVKSFILDEYQLNNRQPIPSWRILEFWLLENNGNYRESIHDTAITLEFLARNNEQADMTGHHPDQAQENVEFYTTYILDQSSLLRTYQETYAAYGTYNDDATNSAVDQIGSEYHNFILAALDVELPTPYVIMLAEAQVVSQDQQSFAKSAGNIISARDLYKLKQTTNLLPNNR